MAADQVMEKENHRTVRGKIASFTGGHKILKDALVVPKPEDDDDVSLVIPSLRMKRLTSSTPRV
jgi:hypothetical protein